MHAIFHPQLRTYKDVIVFSSKGRCSLAEKLSGGDYDGDKAWVCWDPSLVDHFVNYDNPRSLYNLPDVSTDEDLGLEQDKTTVAALLQANDFAAKFLEHGFNFVFQDSMLGRCTAYHEALCYHGVSIEKPCALTIAHLLGRLVDRAKLGIIFQDLQWKNFLHQHRLPLQLSKPAYKNRKHAKPTSHFVDHLVFVIAKNVRERTLRRFNERFKDVGTWDEALARVWKFEHEEAQGDPNYQVVLKHLVEDLRSISDSWNSNVIRPFDDDDEEEVWNKKSKQGQESSFEQCIERPYQEYLNIGPRVLSSTNCPLTTRWTKKEEKIGDGLADDWNLLKASALFCHFHQRNFIWRVAGSELGMLKARSFGRGLFRPVVSEIRNAYKIDSRMAKHAAVNDGLDAAPASGEDLFEDEEVDWDEVEAFCD